MKQILLFLSSIHLLAACTNNLEMLSDSEPRKLIVNALISADRTDNAIFLALSDYREPQLVKNGIIRLYINNICAETVSECVHRPNPYTSVYQNYYYPISSHFHTGDLVRIEVETTDGKYKAHAETRVPEPIEIVEADTLKSDYTLTDILEKLWVYQSTDLKIGLHIPSAARPGYYRVNIKNEYTCHLINRNTLQDSTTIHTYWGCSGYYDMALMDGKPGIPNSQDPGINFIPTINNYYNVFNEAYFTNGEYTMNIEGYSSFAIDNKLYKTTQITGKAIVIYYAISEEEYQYLRAANAYADHNNSNLLETPVLFPGNIKGGVGIFAIENPAVTILPLKPIEMKDTAAAGSN